MIDANYDRVFNRALRLLGRRARSTEQLRERLLEKHQASAEVVERVIARLQELGYLNDRDFAFNYASNKINVKPVGRARLRRTLVHKKVAPEIAENALAEVFNEDQEDELCQSALLKHVRIHGKPADAKEANKLFSYLIRLGFPYDLVMKKVRGIASIDLEE